MKFEKLICAIAVIVALVFGNVPAVRAEGEFDGSSLYAASACLMDGDSGRVLFGKEVLISDFEFG